MVLVVGETLDNIKDEYQRLYQDLEMFGQEVVTRCTLDRDIVESTPKVLYTHKHRVKAWSSLKRKILETNREISAGNLLLQVSDVFGVRLIVLHPSQLLSIDKVIRKNVAGGRWRFRERPKAYEGDQRYVSQFSELGFDVEEKSSYYTSLHYVVEQASDKRVCVEIQVRTLFEEIWGEVEHFVRYKASVNTQEQEPLSKDIDDEMRVLSYIISTGRAHLDLIFRSRT